MEISLSSLRQRGLPRPGRVIVSALWATGSVLAVSWLLNTLGAHSNTAGLAYLTLVVWFATIAGKRVSLYLAVMAALLFDYYFLTPLHSFQLSGLRSWLPLSAFIASCVIVSRVAERARRETFDAEQRRIDVERLYELNQDLMLHGDASSLVRETPSLVARRFNLDAVLLYVRDEDQVFSSVPLQSTTIVDTMRAASAVWELGTEPLEGYAAANLVFGMNSVGTIAWRPATLSREVASSIAVQVAIVLTRAHAVEASARLEAARTTDRLRSALIDSLTHELRTPLTAIRAAATTLLDGYGLDQAGRNELAMIVDEESTRLDELIGRAMEVAEIESDGIRVKPEPVHLAAFLEQAVENSRAELARHAVTIEVAPSPQSGAAATVLLDQRLMGRVLRHLLENAAHYTPSQSRIFLRGSVTHDQVTIEVEDNGPGIDQHDLPLIFEKFYRGRLRGTSTRSSRGSGMGLAITRALLTAQGGTISAVSHPGQGTTFRIQLSGKAGDQPTVDSQQQTVV